MNKYQLARIRDAAILFAIAAVLIAVVRPAIVTAQVTVNSQLCIQNAQKFSTVILEYAQDYDDVLPTLTNSDQLAADLRPYSSSTDVAYLLRCPITQMPYALNLSISGKSLGSLSAGGLGTVELVQDSLPHPDGESTIGYLDGSYTYGGVAPFVADVTCMSNTKQVGLALLEYTQDYDEKLPVFQSNLTLQAPLLPYARSTKIFTCPDTSLLYGVNKSLSGTSLIQYAAPSSTKTLQDARPHPDGKVTTLYLDGHNTQLGQ